MGLCRGQNGRFGSHSVWLVPLHGAALRVEEFPCDLCFTASARARSSIFGTGFLPVYNCSVVRRTGRPSVCQKNEGKSTLLGAPLSFSGPDDFSERECFSLDGNDSHLSLFGAFLRQSSTLTWLSVARVAGQYLETMRRVRRDVRAGESGRR